MRNQLAPCQAGGKPVNGVWQSTSLTFWPAIVQTQEDIMVRGESGWFVGFLQRKTALRDGYLERLSVIVVRETLPIVLL